MIPRILVAAVVAALTTGTASARHFTATWTGIMRAGSIDAMGFFGTSGADLSGMTATALFEIDTDRHTSVFTDGSTYAEIHGSGALAPVLSAQVTVNGHVFSVDLTGNSMIGTTNIGWGASEYYMAGEQNDATIFRGIEPIISSHAATVWGDVNFPNFDADLSGGVVHIYQQISPSHAYQELRFTPTHLSVRDVPEPAGWVLMLAGFGMVGAMLRGRPQRGVVRFR